MTDVYELASRLTYKQRKAIRRAGRGQSISNSQLNDPLIQELLSTEHYPVLPEPYNVCEYTDWETSMNSIQPRLNFLGMEVLHALGDTK